MNFKGFKESKIKLSVIGGFSNTLGKSEILQDVEGGDR